jgi:hypothetical protein
MDVEATTAIRQAEVGAAKTMLDRAAEQFDLAPPRLVASAKGSKDQGDNINVRRGSTPRCVHIKTTSRRTSQAYARDHFSRCQ